MRTYCFIFARGGSKGLPNKNIIDFGGLPLIVHSINIAKEISLIDKIIVSSDSDEILSISENHGAQTIKRPKDLASDEASEWLAWRHAVNVIKEKENFDLFLSLPPTAPLRSKEDILNCFSVLDGNTEIVITVTPSSRSPYFNMVSRNKGAETKLFADNDLYTRRQDVPETFDITTVAYLTRPDFIINNNSIFKGKVKSVIVPKERAIDIDDEFDLMLARNILSNKK